MIHPTSPSRAPRGAFRRALALRPAEWALLAEAGVLLAAASLAIRLLPFRRVVAIAGRPLAPERAIVDPARQIWAVEAVARRVPWRTVCFQKGLALHLMLRRRRVPSLLHYGVGKGEADELAAHVWISVDGAIVMGGDVVDRFRCLATYPAAA